MYSKIREFQFEKVKDKYIDSALSIFKDNKSQVYK